MATTTTPADSSDDSAEFELPMSDMQDSRIVRLQALQTVVTYMQLTGTVYTYAAFLEAASETEKYILTGTILTETGDI